MKTSSNLEQNLLTLNKRVNHVKHLIKVLKEDGKDWEHYKIDLDDMNEVIEQIKRDIANA